MKKVIRLTETQLIRLIKESIENNNLKSEENFFKRRGVDLEKLEEMIYFQESIQEVENFDDGDEFAEFCIYTAVGFYSLVSNTLGANNTAIGISSLRANTLGSNNIATGINCLFTLSNKLGSFDISAIPLLFL